MKQVQHLVKRYKGTTIFRTTKYFHQKNKIISLYIGIQYIAIGKNTLQLSKNEY
nr:MAG TPA_asm: hypothetical protein [Bacteriophage sp.]